MTNIRVETEKLQSVAGQLKSNSTSINSIGGRLLNAGLSARTYDSNTFGPKIRTICSEANLLASKHSGNISMLSTTLDKKNQAFLLVDNSAQNIFGSITNPILGHPIPAETARIWKNIDRSADVLLNFLKNNPSVGQMEKMGHALKSKELGYGMMLFGGLVKFFTDPELSTDPLHAGKVAVAEVGIEEIIKLNPIGLKAMLINSGVQLFGFLASESSKSAGDFYGGEWQNLYYEQSQSLNDNFDQVDLGNIPHDLANIFTDSYPVDAAKNSYELLSGKITFDQYIQQDRENFQSVANNINNLGTHLIDLPVGIIKSAGDTISTNIMDVAAGSDKIISALPVPDAWQSAVHNACIEVGRHAENAL